MNILITIIGESGCGKNYITNKLMREVGMKMLVSCTTRLIRDGEEDGVDYHFMSREEFDRLEKENKFIEVVEYNGNKYGFTKDEIEKLKDSHCVAIVTPSGYHQLSSLLKDVLVIPVYLNTDPSQRKEKLLSRHRNEENFDFYINQIEERMEQDKVTFKDVRNLPNVLVFNVDYTDEVAEGIVCIISQTITHIMRGRENINVFVDFDDVLVPTLEKTLEKYNSINGTNWSLEDIDDWNIDKKIPNFISYFYEVDYENIEQKRNSVQWIREINKYYNVFIATASDSYTFLAKEKWLRKNMPFIPWKNIMCIRDKSHLSGHVLIDDGAHNIKDCNCNMKVLYDAPHNQDFSEDFYDMRVYGLSRIASYLIKQRGYEIDYNLID